MTKSTYRHVIDKMDLPSEIAGMVLDDGTIYVHALFQVTGRVADTHKKLTAKNEVYKSLDLMIDYLREVADELETVRNDAHAHHYH